MHTIRRTLTRRRLVTGAAAATGTAILAACSVEIGPTATPAPLPTATPLGVPTRAATLVPGSSVAGASVVAGSPAVTATRMSSVIAGSPSVVVGSATAAVTPTRLPVAMGGSPSAAAGSATASATATRVGLVVAGSPSAVAGSAMAGTGNGMASVRVVHASPDAPAVDVYVDGQQAIIALPFGRDSGYRMLPPGRHDIRVFAAGANPMRDRPLIDGSGTSIGGDARITVIALGRANEVRGVIADDRTANPAAGKAKVKFIHAAPDAPAVDIAIRGGMVLFPGTEYGRSYPYQEVDARMYDLEVRMAGRTDVVLAIPGVNLAAGQVYSLYALGFVNGMPRLSVGVFTDR